MSRQIQHQDVLNIKTRFRLFFLSIIFGAVVGAVGGWQWVHKGMDGTETEIFDVYTQAWALEKIGFGNLSIRSKSGGGEGAIIDAVGIGKRPEKPGLTATQFLAWMHHRLPQIEVEFDTKTRQMVVYFPAAGALAGAVLLFGLAGLIKKEGN